jgi:predicted nucleic acid-binding Zn ribbon protein
MLVDRYGHELPRRIEPPPSSECYMGQRSDETCEEYETRRDRERRREIIGFVIGALILLAIIASVLWKRIP